jgi:hypothetical protein
MMKREKEGGRDTRFFTETFDPMHFQEMLEFMNTRKTEDPENNRKVVDGFNSRFSTFSKHTLMKSNNMDDFSEKGGKSRSKKIRYERRQNPFVKDSPSNTSNSNQMGEIRHSLPATGQWEGHSRPVYFTESVKSQFHGNTHFGKSSEMLPVHKSENISIAEGSHSKNPKLKLSKTTELNTSFIER